MSDKFDAFLLLSFGGPEGMDDVMPFLDNVLRGRNVPEERKREVAHHYELFGGISPINEQNRQLLNAVKGEFAAHGLALPVYWGNRNWHPMLADTLRQMRDDGIKRALAFVTSAYSSYSGCRQYLDDIEHARAQVGEGAPEVEKLRAFYNHPEFVQANVDHVRDALAAIAESRRPDAHVAFTAHSVPLSMADNCLYVSQLQEVMRLIALSLDLSRYELVFQSRSGPPSQPWLEPDIGDHIKALAQNGVADVVVAPIGFVSDHMEIVFDLDTEASQIARECGINMVRARTAGTHPRFVTMIRQLVHERLDPAYPRASIGNCAPAADFCPPECCPPPAVRASSTAQSRARE
jgi:ferrochelatase